MADLEGTHHFDGDGCAEVDRWSMVELRDPDQYTADGKVYAGDLGDGEVFRFLDDGDTWWHAVEVAILDGDGETVHIEYEEVDPSA